MTQEAASHLQDVIPLTGLRGTIARRMTESQQTKPQVTLHRRVPAERLLAALRDAEAALGRRVTLTALMVALVGRCLRRYPRINGRVEGGEIRIYRPVNVGVATALPDGLTVPVIRDADVKDLAAIGAELEQLTERARSGRLRPQDLLDGTFTISNLGAYGVEYFTPLVNPPELAILGVGAVQEAPVVRGTQAVAAPFLPLSLSFDHAAIDGAQAAAFLDIVAEAVTDPDALVPRPERTV